MESGNQPKQQIVEQLRNSMNILVTVSSNPSVDELTAALALTLALNKMDKHATAVFSGTIPPAISFLDPQKTFEGTVDSLRDFIIALDKEKADRLRYKVEGDMVRIFITPYRAVITDKDLEFSLGDFNVEAIVAIGVERKEDLDKAIVAHGRILHDATVMTLNTKGDKNSLGSVDWQDTGASSYCEMLTTLSEELDAKILDEQIATALLTGIVASTERFSNQRTTSRAMNVAAKLMGAGANQQLIATKLQQGKQFAASQAAKTTHQDGSTSLKEDKSTKVSREDAQPQQQPKKKKNRDGEMHISHEPAKPSGPTPKMQDDEVGLHADQIESKHEQEALKEAEEELANALPQPTNAGAPTLADLERELKTHEDEEARPRPEPTPFQQPQPTPQLPPPPTQQPQPAQSPSGDVQRPPMSPVGRSEENQPAERPSWMGKRIEPPTMGGTLNATTDRAMEDKMREEEAERNKTLLSHDAGAGNQTPAGPPPPMDMQLPQLAPTPLQTPQFGPLPPPPPMQPTSPVAAAAAPPVADTMPPVAAPAGDPNADLDAARRAVEAALGPQLNTAAPPSPFGYEEAPIPAPMSPPQPFAPSPAPQPYDSPQNVPPPPPAFGGQQQPSAMPPMPPLPPAFQQPGMPQAGSMPPPPANPGDPGQFRIPHQ